MNVYDKTQRATKDMQRRKLDASHNSSATPYRDEYIRNSRSFPIYEDKKNVPFNIYEDEDADDKLNKLYEQKGRVSTSAQHDKFNKLEGSGLGDELVKWMKKATIGKEESSGKMRKPLGDNVASPGRKKLQKKGLEKKELEKIHKRVQSSDMC